MGKVMYMRKGESHSVPSPYDPVFANNTWEQIIKACQMNKVPDTWEVGDQKAMNLQGSGTSYLIDIIGKNHDDYADGSGKAPLTFQLHTYYITAHIMASYTATNSWTSCEMRTTHLPAIKALMPIEVQAALRKVNKLTSMGSESSVIVTTEDDLFLLSEIEIFGTRSYSYAGEGSQYAFYAAGNTKKKNVKWWERSPTTGATKNFCNVHTDGTADNWQQNNSAYASFAFCF